jgi:hypothetical protein
MTSLPPQSEDVYKGKIKCNVCGHKEDQHRFAHDCCLVEGCDCIQFAKPGGLG